jgi:hypothetical protein
MVPITAADRGSAAVLVLNMKLRRRSRRRAQVPDGLLAPFRPGRFAERATRVLLEVESVFRDPTRQDRST